MKIHHKKGSLQAKTSLCVSNTCSVRQMYNWMMYIETIYMDDAGVFLLSYKTCQHGNHSNIMQDTCTDVHASQVTYSYTI